MMKETGVWEFYSLFFRSHINVSESREKAKREIGGFDMKRRLMALLVALSMVFPLAACGGSSSSSSGAASSGGSAASSSAASGGEEESYRTDKKAMVWAEVIAITYQETIGAGIEAYCNENGYEFKKVVATEMTQAAMNEIFDTYAAMGYQIFMGHPLDDGTSADAEFGQLKDQGDFIFMNLNSAGVANSNADAYVGPSNYDRLCMMAEDAAAAIDYKGKIGIAAHSLSDTNAQIGLQAFHDTFEKYPDIEISFEIADITELSQAYAQLESAIASNPDTQCIVVTGAELGEALGPVIEDNFNKTGKMINGYAVDDSEVVLAELREGWLAATYTANPYCTGYVGAYIADMLNQGKTLVEGDEGYYNYTTSLAITQENIDTYSEDVDRIAQEMIEEVAAKFN